MIGSPTLTNYTFSKTPTINFNTVPPSIARSATGSVYAVGDTGYTTPLNMTMVIGGAVVTTISSDALGLLPDFTLLDRTTCVWKQTGSSFATVLTTSDPIPGPPGPNTVPTDAAIAAALNDPTSQARAAGNATYVPGNPTLVVTYNPDGSVASTTENGVLTTFTYNTNGTVNTQTRAGVTKTFTYDANGNVTGAA